MSETDKTIINIATACDNAYVQHTAVFLKSLFAKNPNINFRIFIFVPDNFLQRESLERNLGSHSKYLKFLQTDLSKTETLKIVNHVTPTTYFRLFIDSLVPAHVDRIIYLNSDILIMGTLEELWTTDLGNNVIAAVADSMQDTNPSVREQIGLAPTAHYFNAGVLLIDLSRWRKEKIGGRAISFAIQHPELITFEDQCALNHVINGQFRELTKDWNFQTHHLRWAAHGKCTADVQSELNVARIIHFTGQMKPWDYMSNHPMKGLYWKFLHQTEWRSYCPADRTRRNIWRRNLEISRNVLGAYLEKRAPLLLNAGREVRKIWRPTTG